MNNPIYALLAEVQRTGRLPDDDQVAAVVNRGRSARDKHGARTTIRQTAQKIINAMDSGLPDQAEQLAEAVAEELGGFTGNGSTGVDGRALAAGVARTRTHRAEPTTAATRENVKQLEELLTSRIRTGVTAADLDEFALRPSTSTEERATWRANVVTASRRITDTYQAGQQGLARRLAAEYAAEHARQLAQPEQRDPHESITDPRDLADLVPRDRTR